MIRNSLTYTINFFEKIFFRFYNVERTKMRPEMTSPQN